jgi:hypothetical protein
LKTATENPKNSLFKNKFSANSQNFEHQKTALDLLSTCSLSLKQLLNDYELNSIARCARSKTIWGKWWLKELRDGKLFKLHCLKWTEPRFNVNYNKNNASLICGMEDSDTWENKT